MLLREFFGYLKQRTRRFYNNINTLSIKSITAIIRNQTTLTKIRGGRIAYLTGSMRIRDPYYVSGLLNTWIDGIVVNANTIDLSKRTSELTTPYPSPRKKN
jgi:hypothetical protein